MNIPTVIRHSNEYVRGCAQKLFNGAPKKKVNFDWYSRDLKGAVFYGIVCGIQEILNSHRNTPYEDVDTLIGDLEILLKESYEISRKQMKLPIPPLNLEKIISYSQNKQL